MPDLNLGAVIETAADAIILKDLELDHLPAVERAKLREQLCENITQSILLRVIQSLGKSDREHLSSILESGSGDMLSPVLEEKVPRLLDIVGEEIETTKRSLLARTRGT